MSNPLLRTALIRLTHEEPDGRVCVDDGVDRIVLTVAEAIEACQQRDEFKDLLDRFNVFKAQLQALISLLKGWADEHRAQIADAFFQVRRDRQMLLIVLKSEEYDPDLEDSLTNLTLQVANDGVFSLIRLDVQAVPKCDEEDVRSFVDFGKARGNGAFPIAR